MTFLRSRLRAGLSGPGAAWTGLVARLVVGGVWIWAGLSKLPDPAASIETVRAYELVPAGLVEPVGYLLPALEVVVGIALVAGLLTRGSALLSVLLLVAFVVGIASAWARGLEIDCGCFGGDGADRGGATDYPWVIARDVVLLGLSLLLLRLPSTRFALDSLLFRLPDGPTADRTAVPADTEGTHV